MWRGRNTTGKEKVERKGRMPFGDCILKRKIKEQKEMQNPITENKKNELYA